MTWRRRRERSLLEAHAKQMRMNRHGADGSAASHGDRRFTDYVEFHPTYLTYSRQMRLNSVQTPFSPLDPSHPIRENINPPPSQIGRLECMKRYTAGVPLAPRPRQATIASQDIRLRARRRARSEDGRRILLCLPRGQVTDTFGRRPRKDI